MKLNTKMPVKLIPYYRVELEKYEVEYSAGNLQQAWRCLERAHIIGQRYPYQHTYVHWQMLRFGFKIKDTREIIGQLPRLFVGGVKSFVGKIPVGNPGGANVPPLKPFPINLDIQQIFIKAGVA